MNDNFYPSGLSLEEAREYLARQRSRQLNEGRSMGMMDTGRWGGLHQRDSLSSMLDPHLPGADSLDDIVRQNSHGLQQSRGVTQSFPGSLAQQGDNPTMPMEFGSVLPGYQFGDMSSGFEGLASSSAFPGNSAAFTQQDLMTMPSQSDFPVLPSDTMDTMGAFSNLNMGSMAEDPVPVDLFRPSAFGPGTLTSVNPGFSMAMPIDSLPASAANVSSGPGITLGAGGSITGHAQAFSNNTGPSGVPSSLTMNANLASFPTTIPPSISNPPSLQSSKPPTPQTASHAHFTPPNSAATKSPTPSSTRIKASAMLPAKSSNKNPYSASGFDMLRALSYVSTRPNPKISLGAVDLSCSFVVCDPTLPDCPIIYVSDSFEELTGYNRHEILGQNCRFLQSPDGKVEKGSRREFVDNGVVREICERIDNGEECQAAVLNYRKGGGGFLNLLSLIPIPWGDGEERVRYIVGFQIDLVQCPEAVEEVTSSCSTTAATDDGEGMEVDYRRVRPPPPPLTTASERREVESGIATATAATTTTSGSGQAATMGVDEVSALIQQFTTGGGAATSEWHRQAWERMLLENADDVVHVLSLKGLFLYLSPAGCEKVLEYEVDELMGTSLSGVCHPSDVVPVMRELKEAQQNATVNIVFRIRRKHSGYMWFESHGTVFGGGEQQAKGRKCVVLVGRERPVLTLRRADVDAHGGIVGEGEFWSKVSASGLLLYITSGVRSLLDLEPSELEGTGMQELMRKESRSAFGRTIEQARRGSISSFKHELVHKRGQIIPAQTTFYPGDAGLGRRQKNTASFLIAQTRLMRMPERPVSSGSGVSNAGDTTAGVIRAGNDSFSGGLVPRQQQFTTGSGECQEDDNIFGELRTARCTSWQYELRQMEKVNRLLAEELAQMIANKKKRKRRKGGSVGAGGGNAVKDCANCHRRDTPEWRRGPSGNRDLCNSCGLRWAKQVCLLLSIWL